jgi:hypothetical protein
MIASQIVLAQTCWSTNVECQLRFWQRNLFFFSCLWYGLKQALCNMLGRATLEAIKVHSSVSIFASILTSSQGFPIGYFLEAPQGLALSDTIQLETAKDETCCLHEGAPGLQRRTCCRQRCHLPKKPPSKPVLGSLTGSACSAASRCARTVLAVSLSRAARCPRRM